MCASTVKALYTLLLVHPEGGAKEVSVLKIVQVQESRLTVEILAHVAGEVHLAGVLE